MNSIKLIYYGLVLAFVAGLCGSVLGYVYLATKPRIEMIKDEQLKSSLELVLPGVDGFSEKSVKGQTYWVGLSGGKTRGYVFKVESDGYSSNIELLVGVSPDGVVQGVRVLYQQETPGLGARIEEVRVGEESAWFMRQFKGKKGEQLKLRKYGGLVDGVTGATVSSEAVSKGIELKVSEMLMVVSEDG